MFICLCAEDGCTCLLVWSLSPFSITYIIYWLDKYHAHTHTHTHTRIHSQTCMHVQSATHTTFHVRTDIRTCTLRCNTSNSYLEKVLSSSVCYLTPSSHVINHRNYVNNKKNQQTAISKWLQPQKRLQAVISQFT